MKLKAVVCDAPAKSYVLQVKCHTGYYSCTKGATVGEYLDGCTCFPQMNAALHSDQSFRSCSQEEYHTCVSILEELPIDLVVQVPLDPMHVIYLGVCKKMMFLWFRARKHIFGQAVRDEISNKLESLRPFTACEFNRKPQRLDELERWKATELRFFLFYAGPIVLRGSLPSGLHTNFLALHCAVTILSSLHTIRIWQTTVSSYCGILYNPSSYFTGRPMFHTTCMLLSTWPVMQSSMVH